MSKENIASVKGLDLPISTKKSIAICNFIRNKYLQKARNHLTLTLEKKKAIPLRRYNSDRAHRKGKVGPGFFPEKASKEIIYLLNSLEANARQKGLNTNSLFLKTAIANRASIPITLGRQRRATKRTHIELAVIEKIAKKSSQDKPSAK